MGVGFQIWYFEGRADRFTDPVGCKGKEGVKEDSSVFQLGNWRGVDGTDWNGKAVGGRIGAGNLEPGLHMLIPRRPLDIRWRCRVLFFHLIGFDFLLLSGQC